MAMRTNQGLSPSDARFGPRSRRYIYCTPVDIFNEHCPPACKHMITRINRGRANVQVVIDFKLVMKDRLECFYTQDGFVAIDCELLGNVYFKAVTSIKTGQVWYLRQFDIANRFWSATVPAVDKTDTRNDRSVVDENCYVCNSRNWLGTITCFQCNSPFIYEEVFPPFDPMRACSMNHAHIEKLPDALSKTLKAAIGSGRKAVGMSFNLRFGVRMPTKAQEHNRSVIWRRSITRQSARHDDFILRQHRMNVAYGQTRWDTLEERIANDAKFRKKLGMKIVTCASNYAPGQVLLSKWCRLAFETCIANGEFSYENIGRKNLRDEDAPDE